MAEALRVLFNSSQDVSRSINFVPASKHDNAAGSIGTDGLQLVLLNDVLEVRGNARTGHAQRMDALLVWEAAVH